MNHASPPVQTDRIARVVVWSVWLGMALLLTALFAADRSNVPLAEDWYMVPAFTGNEPDFGAWLWSQNNEHRVPVPRLVYLAVLFATGGKFVAVGWLNLALQAATAAGLIVFARRLRGRTDVADAFFPLALLHWGHSAVFLFPFLLSLVIPMAATLVIGCALAQPHSLTRSGIAAIVGIALIGLPGCGLVGLLHVPVFAIALGLVAGASWNGGRAWPRRREASVILGVAIAATLLAGALYFVGYYTPWWNPPNPGWRLSLQTAARVLSLGFGMAPAEAWRPFVALTLALLAATAWCLVRAARRGHVGERLRTWGLALFWVDAVGFAFAVGWSRSSWVPQFGIPSRYALFAIPAFVACFLFWTQFGSARWRLWMPRALALAMLVLVPWNTRAGHTYFANWYRDGMRAFHVDVAAGLTIDELARRHQPFLFHALTPEVIEQKMRWLHEAGVEPFDRAVDRRQSSEAVHE